MPLKMFAVIELSASEQFINDGMPQKNMQTYYLYQ